MRLRGRNKVTPEFNMSSMTDIVFLLLIFFMLASTLVTTSAIDILLPTANGKTENKKSVAVSIKKDLNILYRPKKSRWKHAGESIGTGFVYTKPTNNRIKSRTVCSSTKCCKDYGYS